jgi:transposase-like protein
MSRKLRKFTPEERLSILQECEREGQAVTCRKYNLSPSLVQGWKKKYLTKGVDGLKSRRNQIDPETKALQEENERLKRIVARQALEIEFKTELLKHAPIDFIKKKR